MKLTVPCIAVLLCALAACELKVRDTNLPDKAEREESLRRTEEAAQKSADAAKAAGEVLDRAARLASGIDEAADAQANPGAEGFYRFRFDEKSIQWSCEKADGEVEHRIVNGTPMTADPLVVEWDYEIRRLGKGFVLSRLGPGGTVLEKDPQANMPMKAFTKKAMKVEKKWTAGQGASFLAQDALAIEARADAKGNYRGKYVATGLEKKDGARQCELRGLFSLEYVGTP